MIEFRSEGPPYQRGLAHGRAFAPLIQEHIEAACQVDSSWDDEVAGWADRIRQRIAQAAPGQLEELRGIADGAGIDLLGVLKLNYWPEISSATVGLRLCSLIAFTGEEGHPILGKTSDHSLVSTRFLALQRVSNPNGHHYVRGTFLGTLGTRAGLNDAGLAVCGATIVPTAVNEEGVPVMVLMQEILERCEDVAQAIALAERMPAINYGAHLMIADATGHMAVIERLPDRMAVRRPADGLLFNTNHPLAPQTRDRNGAEPALNENSHARLERLAGLTSRTHRTVAGMKEILRCHQQPGAICQHGGPAGLHTTSAYILLPTDGTMLMAPGCPCQHEFIPFSVEQSS